MVIHVPGHILFDTEQSTIRSKARPELDKLGKSLKGYQGTVRIYGYTDDRGTIEYNQKLSQERAEAVKDYLVKECGIASNHLKTKGFGKKHPIVPNNSDSNRQKNRRVEIIVDSK